MQETKSLTASTTATTATTATMSPLGPVLGPSDEVAVDNAAAAVRSVRADRRQPQHVLLQVRPADPFSRYEHLQRHHPVQDSAMVCRSTTAESMEEEVELSGAKDKFPAAKQRNNSEDDESEDEEQHQLKNSDVRVRSHMEDDAEDEQEDDDEDHGDKRNGDYHRNDEHDVDVEVDIEVDVCRDGDESNPSSPVDLTASSRCSSGPESAFLHPLASRGMHPAFTCLANGVMPGAIVPGHPPPLPPSLVNNNHHHPLGVPTVYHLPVPVVQPSLVTVCSSTGRANPGNMTTTTTTTTAGAVQGHKRGLAFSVENILDPNKFTGGRVVQGRISHRRRRRSGSVHEGNAFLISWMIFRTLIMRF